MAQKDIHAVLVLNFRMQPSSLRPHHKLFYCSHLNFLYLQPEFKIGVVQNRFCNNTCFFSDYNHVIIRAGCVILFL